MAMLGFPLLGPRMAPAPFSQKRLTAEKEALYNRSPFCCKALIRSLKVQSQL
jgi:hypothetical protein